MWFVIFLMFSPVWICLAVFFMVLVDFFLAGGRRATTTVVIPAQTSVSIRPARGSAASEGDLAEPL
jgi:hypothetical protein